MSEFISKFLSTFVTFIGTVCFTHNGTLQHVVLKTEMMEDKENATSTRKINEDKTIELIRVDRNDNNFQVWTKQEFPETCWVCKSSITPQRCEVVSHPHHPSHRMFVCKDISCKKKVLSLKSVVSKDQKPVQSSHWRPFSTRCSVCQDATQNLQIMHHPLQPDHISQTCNKTTCINVVTLSVSGHMGEYNVESKQIALDILQASSLKGHFHSHNKCEFCNNAFFGKEVGGCQKRDMIYHKTRKFGPKGLVAFRCRTKMDSICRLKLEAQKNPEPTKWLNHPNVCALCKKGHTRNQHTVELFPHPVFTNRFVSTCGSGKCNSSVVHFISKTMAGLSGETISEMLTSTGHLTSLCTMVPDGTPLVVTWYFRDFTDRQNNVIKAIERCYLKVAQEIIVQHGSMHGWFPNQQPAFIQSYFQGVTHGIGAMFWSNGLVNRINENHTRKVFVDEDPNSAPPASKRLKKSGGSLHVNQPDDMSQLASTTWTQLNFCMGQGVPKFSVGKTIKSVVSMNSAGPTSFRNMTSSMRFKNTGVLVTSNEAPAWDTAINDDMEHWKARNWSE